MAVWGNLSDYKIVRLNARLFPVDEYETALFQKYGFEPAQVEAYTPEEIIPHVADCDALFVVSAALPAEVVDSLSRCQVISRKGIGTDKIDVAAATREGILVTNVPWFCSEEMGDHAMALLLALARKMPEMSETMAQGAWAKARELAHICQRLSECVLGLVGFGYSAQAMARRARGFGMRILATRRNMDAPRDDADALGVEMVGLDTLLAESDYVSLHLPLNSATYHFFDDAMLRKMKTSAYLINTARGAVTDEYDLAAALREGRLAGAGIDTFEYIDPFSGVEGPPDHPFMELDNVILTPHVASASVQAKQDVARGAIENVVAILSGHWPNPDSIVNRGVVPRVPLAEYDASLLEG